MQSQINVTKIYRFGLLLAKLLEMKIRGPPDIEGCGEYSNVIGEIGEKKMRFCSDL